MSSLFVALPLILACVGDVGEGKVAAEVKEAPAPSAEKKAPAKPGPTGAELPIDMKRSSIKALGAKVTAKHPIVFHKWSGVAQVDGEELTALTFEIDVASLEADHPKLTQHLKEEDFLFVEKYPKATFEMTELKPAAADGSTHSVTGKLTIRGKAKQVTFPATIKAEGDHVSAQAEFVIDRKDFDVVYKGRADDLVQDNVVLTIDIQAGES